MVNVVESERPVLSAIYARTSSPNQRSNYSIEEQVNQCWSYCSKRSWIVNYVFIDECESGSTIERPKFQLMVESAKERRFKVITFWKLDRFCRSLVDLVNIERTLRQWGVELCSVTEFVDTTTAIGRFNYRNLASAGELEREIIGERARLGMYGLAREHRWPNPHPPLGYEKDKNGRLAINKKEAGLVRRVFKMYLSEMCMPHVAFKLNTEGIKTKRGREWNGRAVRDVLTNRIYIGQYAVAGVKQEIDEYRIVPTSVFKKANGIMHRYKTSKTKRPSMPEKRRAAQIETIHNQYLNVLKELDCKSLL
jgi:site-specific DNA recombinase